MADWITLAQRRRLLERAPQYFICTENFVRNSDYVYPKDIALAEYTNGFGRWQDRIKIADKYELNFRDIYQKNDGSVLKRTISFDFREQGAPLVIFRVDAHGQPLFGSEAAHLDLANANNIQEGNPLLKGYSLRYFTMADTMQLIHRFLDGGELPWQ